MSAAITVPAAVPQGTRRRLNLGLWLPVGVIALFVLAALLAPWIAPYDPNAQNLLDPGSELLIAVGGTPGFAHDWSLRTRHAQTPLRLTGRSKCERVDPIAPTKGEAQPD